MSSIAWNLYLKYDPHTGEISTIPSSERHESCIKGKIGLQAWNVDGVVFVSIMLNGERIALSAGRLAQWLHTGKLPDREPVYINGQATDLRWINLRMRDVSFVTCAQPATNAKITKSMTPGTVVYAPHDANDYVRIPVSRSRRKT
jgi:hypothetical protein